MGKQDKKTINLAEAKARLEGYGRTLPEGAVNGMQLLTENEVNIAVRACAWINAGSNSQAKLANESGVSETRLSSFFNGRYTGDVHGIVSELAAYLEKFEREAPVAPLPFVETSMWKAVHRAIENARYDKQPVLIFGPSQMGKTECLKHYQSLFPLSVKYYRFHGSMDHTAFVLDMLKLWGVRDIPNTNYKRVEKLYDKVNGGDTLLLDEIQLPLRLARCGRDAENIMEEVRTIFDAKRVGLALCGTQVAYNALTTGPAALLFAQMLKRSAKPVFFSNQMKLEDARKFWEAAGLGEPQTIEQKGQFKAMIQNGGLASVVALLQNARRKALKARRPVNWNDFEKACDEAEDLSQGLV